MVDSYSGKYRSSSMIAGNLGPEWSLFFFLIKMIQIIRKYFFLNKSKVKRNYKLYLCIL